MKKILDKLGNKIDKGDYVYVINGDLFKGLTRQQYNTSYKIKNINYISVSDSKIPIGIIELEENSPFFGYMITNKDVEKDLSKNEEIIDTEIITSCDTFEYEKELENNHLYLANEVLEDKDIVLCKEQSFNEEQLDIINTWNKNLLNIAGPGSGKTTTLTKKIEYYLKNEGNIQDIMVLTFTKAAANEILKRNAKYINSDKIYFGTFHSIFFKLLLENNLMENMILYQPNELENLFINILKNNIEKYFPKELLSNILIDYYSTKSKIPKEMSLNKTIIKNRIFNISTLVNLIYSKVLSLTNKEVKKFSNLRDLIDNLYQDIILYIKENIENKDFYNTYIIENFYKIDTSIIEITLEKTFIDFVNEKYNNNILDYNDILLYLLFNLNYNENLKNKIQKQFKYILVDEYQDTNIITKEILLNIHNDIYNNIIVIGDPYQSIYKFMGATINNIKNSIYDFKTEVKQLTYNYRSNENIIRLTNQILNNMVEKLDIDLKPLKIGNKNLSNNKIYYKIKYSLNESMEYIIKYIQNNPNEKIGILHRKGYVPEIENYLISNKIEYNKLGGIKLNQSLEIKSLMYLINYLYTNEEKYSLEELLKTCYKNIKNIEKTNDKLVKKLKELKSSKKDIKKILKFYDENIFSIFEHKWNYERLKNAKIKIEDLKKDLLNSQEEDILIILNDFILSTQQKKYNPDCNITFSTIHSSKGLEYDTVFLLGLSSEEFKDNQDEKIFAENQRLVYVAVSRAKTKLFLFSEENKLYNIEIDENYMTNELPNYNNENETFITTKKDDDNFVLTFGKYKNYNINNITDYNYLEWLLSKEKDMIQNKLLTKKQIDYIKNNILGF